MFLLFVVAMLCYVMLCYLLFGYIYAPYFTLSLPRCCMLPTFWVCLHLAFSINLQGNRCMLPAFWVYLHHNRCNQPRPVAVCYLLFGYIYTSRTTRKKTASAVCYLLFGYIYTMICVTSYTLACRHLPSGYETLRIRRYSPPECRFPYSIFRPQP